MEQTIDNSNKFDKTNVIIGGLVFLIALTVYYLTKAPTLSFWDSGEFIASSYILGIPHPPGTPLYVIIGRIFSILPIAADLAVRVNLFSVVSGAVAALFGYLVTVRMIRLWFAKRNDTYNRIVVYIGGFTGAMFMAFSNTNWINSVESEVYSPAMLIMMAIFWLALKYYETRETKTGSRYVILMAYLAILGIGIHLTLYLIIPVLGLYFILKRETGLRDWALLSAFFVLELFLIFLLSSRPGEVPFYLPIVIIFIIFLFHSILLNKNAKPILITGILFLIALYPLYFSILGAISTNLTGAGLSKSMAVLGELPIGWIGFAGMIFFGIYSVFQYITTRNKSENAKEWLIPGVYSLAPAILLAAGQIFKGYVSFMFLTAVIVVLLTVMLWRQINWLMLIGLGSISLIIIGFWEFVFGLIFGAVVIVVIGLILKDKSWKTALAIIIMAFIGFSVHIYLPVRAAHNPTINESNPSESFNAFVNCLERKQYGNISMTERMFTRRAEWSNQFGDYRRMGFWRFFKDQYGLNGPRFFIILIFGLFGIWEMIRRKPDIGLPFLVMTILCTVGLVLYMNFADGTRIDQLTGLDYLEVRDRDYFFTPGFIFFGLAIGLGISAFMELIRDTFVKSTQSIRKLTFGVSCALVLMPLFTLANNYFQNDQSRNYMPYDYATNILKSCDKDAILITGGDNDTFPLWCVQEIYGYRTDVKVINLSLSNMGWYIKQLRDILKVPIAWTDAQIDRLVPYRDAEGTVFKIQHQVVDHIISVNKWKYPFLFIVSAGEESFRYRGKPIMDHLTLEGLVMKLNPTKDVPSINFEKTRRLYEEEFQYRGVADPTVYKSETASRLTNNFAQGFLFLADSLRKAKDYEGAIQHIRKGLEALPESYDIYLFFSQTLGEMGRIDTLDAFMMGAPEENRPRMYINWALSAYKDGKMDDAIFVLEQAHELYPEYEEAFHELARIYYQNRYYGRLRELVTKWVAIHPEDIQSQELLRQINSIDRSVDTLEGQE
ncbi:MAG: DUF2723 domain-containing protein [Candidatus Zixiibacteriota bacterium]